MRVVNRMCVCVYVCIGMSNYDCYKLQIFIVHAYVHTTLICAYRYYNLILLGYRSFMVVDIPYKSKYWQGINFSDWRFLDEIANI